MESDGAAGCGGSSGGPVEDHEGGSPQSCRRGSCAPIAEINQFDDQSRQCPIVAENGHIRSALSTNMRPTPLSIPGNVTSVAPKGHSSPV
jgi:hypothetical protein